MAEIKEFKNRMIKTASVLSTQFDTVRAGRANAAVLDQIEVDYYGTPTPIRQIASISSPDARTLLIQPWDGSTLKLIDLKSLNHIINFYFSLASSDLIFQYPSST